jgi:hypothetical protein
VSHDAANAKVTAQAASDVAALRSELATLKARVRPVAAAPSLPRSSAEAVAPVVRKASRKELESRPQIGERFAKERVDPERTAAIKAQLDRALAEEGGASLESIECRGRYCRAAFDGSYTALGSSVASFVIDEVGAREAVGTSEQDERGNPAKFKLVFALPEDDEANE